MHSTSALSAGSLGPAILLTLAILVLVAAPAAQNPSLPEAVIHAWVDAHYGDNPTAMAYNPMATNMCPGTPPPTYPNDVIDPTQGNAVLLNAPWPFRTITGAVAAIPPLPSMGLSGVKWSYAVIHLLPGWYASTAYNTSLTYDSTTSSYYYRDNGLLANGETLPIRLPNRVSVQGTSVLNTIIQLSEFEDSNPESAFEFGTPGAGTGFGTFIANVSIFGHYHEVTQGQRHEYAGAVYCGRAAPSRPTFTNCWFFGNEVAVCLDAPAMVPDQQTGLLPTWHEVTITNCTFAWNECAIWNGMQNAPNESLLSYGRSRTILLNNIFDATPVAGGQTVRTGWRRLGQTAFEGLSWADLTTDPQSGFLNKNAYEQSKYNLQVAIGILPVTRVMPAGGVSPRWNSPPTPSTGGPFGYTLSPWTGNLLLPNGRRGVLYVRDCIENGRVASDPTFWPPSTTSPDPNFDACPADFRLSPAAAKAHPTGGTYPPGDTTNGGLNPLVDKGWNPTSTQTFPVLMWNQLQLLDYPGRLAMTTPAVPWNHHNWNFDGEGYGNPRIRRHPVYTASGDDLIDIGGDELGELIVAGYRFGTTHFVKISELHHPTGRTNPLTPVLRQSNRYLWFLGIPSTHAPALVSTARPQWRVIDTINTLPWVDTWGFEPKVPTPQAPYEPELTDISPHLLPDIHPYWHGLFNNKPCNPIWQHCLGLPIYNPTLYQAADFGIIDPPGSYKGYASDFRWLDGTGTSPVFTEFGPLGGPATFDLFNAWCGAQELGQPTRFFDTFPDYAPASPANLLISRRYSLEHKQQTPWRNNLDGSNLQSFNVMTKTF